MVQAAKACAKSGARVTVLVPSIVPDEGLEKALQGVGGVQLIAMPYRAAGENILRTRLVQLYNIPTLLRLKTFVERERVDTIYSNTSITILGAALAGLTGVRHVWHWHEPVDERFGWHFTLEKLYRQLAQKADTIVCISRRQQEEWKRTLHLELTNAQIIYNPIKRIVPVSSSRYAFHRGARIGFIGRFDERKNIELLIHAFEQLHESEPDTSLWLCGAIDERDRCYVERMTEYIAPNARRGEILQQHRHTGFALLARDNAAGGVGSYASRRVCAPDQPLGNGRTARARPGDTLFSARSAGHPRAAAGALYGQERAPADSPSGSRESTAISQQPVV